VRRGPNLLEGWEHVDIREMARRVQNFQSQVDSGEIPVHCGLAYSYGDLTLESARRMDQELLVMLTGTLKAFNRDPRSKSSWESVMSTMRNNPVLEQVPNSAVHREDGYRDQSTNAFKIDQTPEEQKIERFRYWFDRLVADDDILRDTTIDTYALGNLIAQTGAAVVSFVTLFDAREYYEKTVVDIGLLRFPDPDHPYVKVYRIQIKVWRDTRRILFVQTDKHGVSGIFDSMKFRPRQSVMDALSPELKQKTADAAVQLLED
jgi:hypothetical protein